MKKEKVYNKTFVIRIWTHRTQNSVGEDGDNLLRHFGNPFDAPLFGQHWRCGIRMIVYIVHVCVLYVSIMCDDRWLTRSASSTGKCVVMFALVSRKSHDCVVRERGDPITVGIRPGILFSFKFIYNSTG